MTGALRLEWKGLGPGWTEHSPEVQLCISAENENKCNAVELFNTKGLISILAQSSKSHIAMSAFVEERDPKIKCKDSF